ncbi:MAG: hypothetical protein DYG89_04595 [Caldilinea sp. CFX5]|nr:hypothetical protein [Caldilinea sp. CFX5]
MTTVTLDPKTSVAEPEREWLPVFEAALRVGKFSSLDELIYRALDSWLVQLAPELRWNIAIDLYTNGQISTGRAAQIAGLNYVVFEERLRELKIPFMAAGPGTADEQEEEEKLIYAGFNIPHPQ